MKVLMTGMSPPQCARPTLTGYEHVSELWKKALQAGGAEVDHRRAEPNEDLSGYDVALVGLVPPNSIAARYLYTALDVIARARASGCGLVFYVDDWRFYAVTRGVKAMAKNPVKRLVETSMFDKFWHRDWAVSDGWPRMVETLISLRDQPWPTTLVPAFTWGNPELMPTLPTVRQVAIDPSVFARPYEIPVSPPEQRRRAWVLGTFSDQRVWQAEQGFTWETDYIGTKRSRATKRLKEWDLVRLYGDAWGVLAAPYEHAGSGWWRNRFVYAAAGEAVLYSAEREVAGLPGYWESVQEIESLPTKMLRDFAVHQSRLMQESYASAEQVVEAVTSECQAAHDLATGSTAAENEAVA